MMPEAAFFEGLRARKHALVMGVLNVTPDSFSDGGLFLEPASAEEAARRMVAEGAGIVDVGGESTRPGADPISPAEERERVLPVLERLRGVPVSVDTRHTETAEEALRAGAVLINDVTAGESPGMFEAVASHAAGLVLMHKRGEPGTMQRDPHYDDVVGEVEAYLLDRAAAAERAGVPRERIFLDPGIGFGKTVDHNLALLHALPRLVACGYPALVGTSRKSFLGAITRRPVDERRDASTATVALSAYLGAAVVRVHDVAPALDAVRIAAGWVGGKL